MNKRANELEHERTNERANEQRTRRISEPS